MANLLSEKAILSEILGVPYSILLVIVSPCFSGWWFQPSWKIWKSTGRIIPYIMEHKKCSKPPTSSGSFEPKHMRWWQFSNFHRGKCRSNPFQWGVSYFQTPKTPSKPTQSQAVQASNMVCAEWAISLTLPARSIKISACKRWRTMVPSRNQTWLAGKPKKHRWFSQLSTCIWRTFPMKTLHFLVEISIIDEKSQKHIPFYLH